MLADNARLAIVVDTTRADSAGHAADVQVTFEKNRVSVCGPFGCWWRAYERGYVIALDRRALEPAWGAWRGPALGIAALATVASLFVMWWGLAVIYTPLAKLIAFYCDRVVTWSGAWRLSGAALLPGGILVALALLLYGIGALDLFRFSLLYFLHVLCGLVFVVTSPLFLPKISQKSAGRNPFGRST
jgi:hypothetical protein